MSKESTSSCINWGEAFSWIKHVPKIPDIETCLHPEVYNKLIDGLPKVEYKSLHSLYGMKITISEHIPKHPKKWEFPKCRFVEYEKKMKSGPGRLVTEEK